MMTQVEALKVVDEAIARYTGDVRVLESAVGVLLVGLWVGWRPLLLAHSLKAFKGYERVLGVKFKEVLPEVGPLSGKMVAWTMLENIKDFCRVSVGSKPGRSIEMQELEVPRA